MIDCVYSYGIHFNWELKSGTKVRSFDENSKLSHHFLLLILNRNVFEPNRNLRSKTLNSGSKTLNVGSKTLNVGSKTLNGDSKTLNEEFIEEQEYFYLR